MRLLSLLPVLLLLLLLLLLPSSASYDPKLDPNGVHPLPRPLIIQYPSSAESSEEEGLKSLSFTSSSSSSSEEEELQLRCDSWRVAGEANNLAPWRTIPWECAGYVKAYMNGRPYLFDLEMVAREAGVYAGGVCLDGDGRDVWVFDVDETLLSNLPYYADHHYGGQLCICASANAKRVAKNWSPFRSSASTLSSSSNASTLPVGGLGPLSVFAFFRNGLFLLRMAKRQQTSNFLGLDINEKLVARCLDDILQCGINNVYFLSTNATSTFHSIISSYPGKLVLVSIQCPNPDFNKTEHRWKMVQRMLVEAIIDLLAANGKVFLQSDIEEVARRMKKEFMMYGNGKLVADGDDGEGWIKENPFGVRSDWEQHVLDRGAPMYRVLIRKVSDDGEL